MFACRVLMSRLDCQGSEWCLSFGGDDFAILLDIVDRVEKQFQAKTGTLSGVNTLVGYFQLDDGRLIRFVILVNDQVPFDHRFRLAKRLHRNLNRNTVPKN